MSPMPAGRRVHWVLFQNPSGAPVMNGDGDHTQAYVDLKRVQVAIEPATAQALERKVASTVIANATAIVTAPYFEGVTTKSRIVFGERTLYVAGVANPEERNVELILACTEVAP